MSKRNRPRHNKSIKTVLQAFQKKYGKDFDAFDSMILSLSPGEGIGVYKNELYKFHFYPATELGAYQASQKPIQFL